MAAGRPVLAGVPGTKPGLHSQTLISTGQADLDRILGGGLPLGTVFCILEDSLTQHHTTLLRYFIAEAVACGRNVLYASSPREAIDMSKDLPKVVEPSSRDQAGEELADDSGLKIAWQYRRYIQDKTKAATQAEQKKPSAFQRKDGSSKSANRDNIKAWCHHFDLARPMADADALQRAETRVYEGHNSGRTLIKDISRWANRSEEHIPIRAAPNGNAAVQSSNDSAASRSQTTPAAQPVRRLMSSMARPADTTSASSDGLNPPASRRGDQAEAPADPKEPVIIGQSQPFRSLMSSMSRPSNPHDSAVLSAVKDSEPGRARYGQETGPNPNAQSAGSSVTRSQEKASAFKPRLRSFMSKPASVSSSQEGNQPPLQTEERFERSNLAADLAQLRVSEEQRAPQASGRPSVSGLHRPLNPTQCSNVRCIAVHSLGSPQWDFDRDQHAAASQLLQTVHQLKGVARASQAAIMLSVPAGQFEEDVAVRLQHMCDAAVTVEAVQEDSHILKLISDAPSCVGALHVNRLPTVNSLCPPVPATPLYVIRHKRRNITVQPFEVDPDAEAALIEAESSSGKSGAASLICGGPPMAENKSFDF